MGFKFNPFIGNLDIAGSGSSAAVDNFSYKVIEDGLTVTIPESQQMLVDGHVTVLGHLTVLGELKDISNRKPELFFYDFIDQDQVIEINIGRMLLYKNHFRVLGHLRVNGRLEVA